MRGDDRVRYCPECKLNVYNLAAMPRDEAEDLVRNREGRLCARVYRRADGSVLTQDCPVGLRAVRRKIARLVAGTAAMLSFLTLGAAFGRPKVPVGANAGRPGMLAMLARWLEPPPVMPKPLATLKPSILGEEEMECGGDLGEYDEDDAEGGAVELDEGDWSESE